MPDRQWTLSELGTLIPIAASAFAFAFVVGYFSAYDLAWFPFFSLSEHLVLALRALPMAIGASVGLLIAMELAQTAGADSFVMRHRNRLLYSWIAILVFSGFWILLHNHWGLALTAWVIAYGVFHFQGNRGAEIPFGNVILWIANIMAASVIAGYLIGGTWRVPKILDWLVLSRAVLVKVDTGPNKGKPYLGHVISAGAEDVLFYDFEGTTRLLHRKDITEMFECGHENMRDKSCLSK